MDVAFLIRNYFKDKDNLSIDVFDSHTLNEVYQQVIRTLTSHFEIEISVLQSLSYCFYEIMDNIHIHSGKPLGTALTQYDRQSNILRVLVADDGIGIHASLIQNPQFKGISEDKALLLSVQDSITDGHGMGFGLYATARLMQQIGLRFIIHSGRHKLQFKDKKTEVIENGLWQGTIVFLEISTSDEIDPNAMVDYRTDADDGYNEAFIETDNLCSLW